MVKRCSYVTCNSDDRYPERLGDVQFHPFPKPARNLEKCMKWIRLCGRPLILDRLRNHSTAKHIYVCSKVIISLLTAVFNHVAQSFFYFDHLLQFVVTGEAKRIYVKLAS